MNDAQSKGVLLIEDDDAFAGDLLRLWAPPGPVRRAASGREALRRLQEQRPALILLDLCLPHALADTDDDEGLCLLTHIRQGMQWAVPVIVVTRDHTPSTRARAVAEGADAVLYKPVDVGELERIVARLIGSSPGQES